VEAGGMVGAAAWAAAVRASPNVAVRATAVSLMALIIFIVCDLVVLIRRTIFT
jgi:hypothetical protein